MGSPCPKYRAEYQQVFSIPAVEYFMEEHKDLFDYLLVHAGERIIDLGQIQTMYSTLFIEVCYSYCLLLYYVISYQSFNL